MKTERLTIHDIKRLSEPKSPYFFSRDTLKFFGQTLKSFSVTKYPGGRYLISAPMVDRLTGRKVGTTERIFNPVTNELELIQK